MKNFKMLLCATAAVLSMQQTVMGSRDGRPNPSSMEVHIGSIKIHVQRLDTELHLVLGLPQVTAALGASMLNSMGNILAHARAMPEGDVQEGQYRSLIDNEEAIVNELESISHDVQTAFAGVTGVPQDVLVLQEHLNYLIEELNRMIVEMNQNIDNSCLLI